MQRIVLIVGRFVFTGTLMLLFLALFVGEVVSISQKKSSGGLIIGKISNDRIIVAAAGPNGGLDNSKNKISDAVVSDDARPILIKKYLEKYDSPLAPYSDLIFKLSQTNGFDYYWIIAIGQQESNLCKKIPEGSHNCWGYGINSAGTLRFDSYELALNSYAQYLKKEYFDKGYNTPEKIMKKYCPSSNGSWAFGVNKFIQEIEAGQF